MEYFKFLSACTWKWLTANRLETAESTGNDLRHTDLSIIIDLKSPEIKLLTMITDQTTFLLSMFLHSL